MLNYHNKKIILDGSHNTDGAVKLKDFLEQKKIKPVVVFGMLNNKKINVFLNTIKNQIRNIIAIEIPNEKNTFKLNEIGKSCKLLSIDYLKINNVNELVRFIEKSEERFFLITGSLYLVGKVRNRFL